MAGRTARKCRFARRNIARLGLRGSSRQSNNTQYNSPQTHNSSHFGILIESPLSIRTVHAINQQLTDD
ncbi:hypothetical protein [Paraburkholderia sp. J94]|uniref:hypothetical protein n=1 Tax=Paraburkholderia sp. J94 TaxID=2805441 RepID=UPI002AB14FF9|nr:hypothetical protein [Paraburkholderia sp. J94]